MKNNQEPVTQTEEKTEGSVVTQTTENKTEEKTFTQADLNKLEMKLENKYKEKYKGYNEWLESQKTEADKKNELTQENVAVKQENASLKQLLSIIDKGVSKDEAEFIQFKVSKMEGDFEDNLENYLNDNPKYFHKASEVEEKGVTNGVAVNKISTNSNSGVNAILKAKYPDLF